ncbi:MAG: hypothetical protein CL772_02300 [Chloroflexi bacterium]|nr:hypothetical protein [Chloroflexota bacterium]|tara:strand:+ start:34595 stop:35629 length:1035 start_codon:yes stop_codon:yes gene_type:complete
MSNKKTLFSFKKGVINFGSTHEKKEYIQSLGILVAASFGEVSNYRQVIEAVESKIDGKASRRNIRGAIRDLATIYPVEFLGEKQIEKIKINKNGLKKIIIGECQSQILKYIYEESSEIKTYFIKEFNLNERQFYRYINGEKEITDKQSLLKIAGFISIFLSSDQKFKYYPTFSQKLLDKQIGYLFTKTTPLFSVNPTLEEIFGISFIMNKPLLIYYFSKLCKELNFSGEESFKVIKNLLVSEAKEYNLNLGKYLDFFHTMDNDGEFIDPETINRSSNMPIKKRINLVPKIEKDIRSSLPELFIDFWKNSKDSLGKLRIEVGRQIKSRKSIKRDLLNDKLASYFR